jgi:DNA-cytosine methyltransferase
VNTRQLQLETMYKIVDLFSGIGGFSYAAEQIVGGFETVAFVERDEYCQKVLRKHWSDVPIYSDIRSFNGKEYKDADIVVGGFPCQPWSVAGSQRGSEDDRDLWHEMVRIIKDIRPRWIIGENVSGFVTMPMGLTRSLVDLESIGYKAIPYLIPAAAVDAKHRRMRCWIVGHSEHDGSSATPFRGGNEQINGGSPQGQNKASELEGASGQQDNGYVQTDIFDFVADTNNSRDRTPASGIDTEQQEIEQGRAYISQSESSRQREDVANTENRRGEQTEWQRGESISGRSIDSRGDKAKRQEDKRDVSNTESKGLERRIHSSAVSSKGNESTYSGDIYSGERNNVADTDNKGVRTRIDGSDDDLPKESGERRNDRTTSGTDVRGNFKTTENGEMGLSEKGDVPYTIGKRGCSGSTRGEDAKDVRQSSFREGPVLWNAEPNVGRVANGVPNRVHRLRCLGNSIVPQVVARIFYAIKEAENDK